MTALAALTVAPSGALQAFVSPDFWIGVGVLAAIYGVFTLGLQLNVGNTGIVNFGQAGFMAIGAFSMAILVVKLGWPFGIALAAATAITVLAGVLVALPTLRLREDYFAIVTLALAEIIRYTAQNARGLTGGNQGLLGFDGAWVNVASGVADDLDRLAGLRSGRPDLLPLLVVAWTLLLVLAAWLSALQRTPWGRVLRAIREDEDAARALGKNPFAYKLQSVAIAAAMGGFAGYLLALQLIHLSADSFQPQFTFIGYTILVLGGLGSYAGVVGGSVVIWALLEATRFVDLPLSDERIAALRFMLIGTILIAVMVVRPHGLFGKREEMHLGS
ncbi:MAG: branched-chain amino acid transport system permease protein [Solirubrobacteraceae bacterium]